MSESRRGRPRDADVDERVLRATTDLLLTRGYAGLSVDEVAERAQIAKTTLYRRWPTKDHLALAVVTRLQDDDEITDTGDIRRDLADYLEKIAAGLNRMRAAGRPAGQQDDPSAGTVAELVAAAARHDDIGRLERAMYARRNALARRLLERARERGELRPDLDLEALFDQLAGALYYRVLITGDPVGRAYAERLVASALAGALNREGPP
ncbi:TetR/AcrR family transcriptional regulator [Streptosporangium sp. NBC_01756]|uniref:TetR/AcrR family transcriptional regulator n=1 Tax=Streptosporangium sp. NBC_01756 TaxID=2975950 RepID=UPI002DD8C0D1|nr:TetR/AcrR family transcriptional regulator [Streptosporangium sp. NBC_01756]WSC89230.1 TetR/AcrR family transcriptional regulator [Streptosporangium sp. NBC_01756]